MAQTQRLVQRSRVQKQGEKSKCIPREEHSKSRTDMSSVEIGAVGHRGGDRRMSEPWMEPGHRSTEQQPGH